MKRFFSMAVVGVSLFIGALVGLAPVEAQTTPIQPIFRGVWKSTMHADSTDVQAIKLVIPYETPNDIDRVAVEVNREHPVSPTRGRFRYNKIQGFYEHGDNIITGNAFVTLLPENPSNPTSGSQRYINAKAKTATFIFRWTADPTYGDVADNDIDYTYSASAQGFVSGWQHVDTSFVVDADGYEHSSFADFGEPKTPVFADGNDVQVVKLVIKTAHPDVITDARIRINAEGPNAPQGYFAWRPTGFYERTGDNLGNENVTLLTEGPNASTRVVMDDPALGPIVVFYFRWTIDPAVGATTGNTIRYSWTEMQYRPSSNGDATETFDTVLPPTPPAVLPLPTLQVSIDSSNPDAHLYAAGTQGVVLATFNFYTTGPEDVDLDSVYFTQRVIDPAMADYHDYDLLYLTDENGIVVGSVVPTSTKPFIFVNDGSVIVENDDTDGKKLYLKANLSQIGPSLNVTTGGHSVGHNIAIADDVRVKGALSGATAAVSFGHDAPNGNTHRVYKGVPMYENLPLSSMTFHNGVNDLFMFRVSAVVGDIGLYKFTFDITATGAEPNQFELYDVTNSSEVLLYSKPVLTHPTSGSGSYIFDVFLDDDTPEMSDVGREERVVAVGTPRTFVLRGIFTGVSSGDSVSTRMAGDHEGFSSMTSADAVDFESHNDFIWSDRHAMAHSTATFDWTNGYLVSGLPAVSTTAQVLSL